MKDAMIQLAKIGTPQDKLPHEFMHTSQVLDRRPKAGSAENPQILESREDIKPLILKPISIEFVHCRNSRDKPQTPTRDK